MAVNLLLGLQWGDEGKGKIVDVLTKNYDIIARFQGGPNAGHTLEFDGIKHVLHTIPSGIFHDTAVNVIGNGVVIDPMIFKTELDKLKPHQIDCRSRLRISRKAHLILPTHSILDAVAEAAKGKTKIGSTLKGIGPAYMDKTGRNGIRIGDLESVDWKDRYRSLADKHLKMISCFKTSVAFDLHKKEQAFFAGIQALKEIPFIDSESFFYQAQKQGKSVLAEGAQGSLLDIDFGTYPYVTSSNTTAAGACTGLGIAPSQIHKVFGVFKAYTTRVGRGPFPTELHDKTGEKLAKNGNEFGSTTGRARRCGWLDLVALKYAVRLNGVTALMMMKADVLSGIQTVKICTGYKVNGQILDHFPYSLEKEVITPVYTEMEGWSEDLTTISLESEFPKALHSYINFLENELEVPIIVVSVGPDRSQTIARASEV